MLNTGRDPKSTVRLQDWDIDYLELVTIIGSHLGVPNSQFKANICAKFGLELGIGHHRARSGVGSGVNDIPVPSISFSVFVHSFCRDGIPEICRDLITRKGVD